MSSITLEGTNPILKPQSSTCIDASFQFCPFYPKRIWKESSTRTKPNVGWCHLAKGVGNTSRQVEIQTSTPSIHIYDQWLQWQIISTRFGQIIKTCLKNRTIVWQLPVNVLAWMWVAAMTRRRGCGAKRFPNWFAQIQPRRPRLQ